MTLSGFLNLAGQTLVAPRDVANLLLSLRLGREALLLGFAAVVVVNTLLVVLSNMAVPAAGPFQSMLSAPLIVMMMLGGTLAITAIALTWCGRALGGTGRLEDLMILMIWLQALWAVVRTGVLLLMPVSTLLAAFLAFASSIAAVWLLVHFIDAAHEFGSLLKSALVLLLGVTGMALGISFLFSLIGVTSMGMTSYV